MNDQLKKSGRCLVVISEGFDVGELGAVKDSFGHTSFSASQMTVAQIVVNYLNKVGLAAKGAARGNVPGTDQRHAMAYASTVDLEEAYRSGQMAALLAAARRKRLHGDDSARARADLCRPATTKCRWKKSPPPSARFPRQWIAANGYDVTDEFLRYARPLVGDDMVTLPLLDGRQRLTRFKPIYAEQKLPKYVPQADRKK